MGRIHPVQEDKATGQVKEIYGVLKKNFGRVPNIFLHLGNAPAALEAFVQLNECANKTSLPPSLRSAISLTIAQINRCAYCLSAHAAIATNQGMDDSTIHNARNAQSTDKKTATILQFVKKCVEKRGDLHDEDLKALKAAGVSDQEVAEIVLLVALNMYTNYFNKIINTEIDFPLQQV